MSNELADDNRDEETEGHRSSAFGHQLSADWQAARELAEGFAPYSNMFTRTVRALCTDEDAHQSGFSQHALLELQRVFRSASVRAMLYYALRTLDERALNGVDKVTPGNLLSLTTTAELSALLAFMYLTRRVRSTVTQEEAARLLEMSQDYCDLGFYIGRAIPALGVPACVFAGSLRYLIFAQFLRTQRKKFKSYWVELKRTKQPFNLNVEREHWGCTHLQVASVVIQRVGFGRPIAEAYARGIEAKEMGGLSQDALKFAVARRWVDELMLNGRAPDAVPGDEYLLAEKDADALEERLDILIRNGSTHQWLAKNKGNLSPAKTAQLYFADLDGEGATGPEDIEEGGP